MNVGVWIPILTPPISSQLTAIFWGFSFPISNGSNDTKSLKSRRRSQMLIKHPALGLLNNRCLTNGRFHDDSYDPGCFLSFFFLLAVFFFLSSLYVFNIFQVGSLLIQSSFLFTCISPHKPLISYSPSSPARSVDQHSHPFQQKPSGLSL